MGCLQQLILQQFALVRFVENFLVKRGAFLEPIWERGAPDTKSFHAPDGYRLHSDDSPKSRSILRLLPAHRSALAAQSAQWTPLAPPLLPGRSDERGGDEFAEWEFPEFSWHLFLLVSLNHTRYDYDLQLFFRLFSVQTRTVRTQTVQTRRDRFRQDGGLAQRLHPIRYRCLRHSSPL